MFPMKIVDGAKQVFPNHNKGTIKVNRKSRSLCLSSNHTEKSKNWSHLPLGKIR